MSPPDRIDPLTPGRFRLDGQDVEFGPGESILQAALRAGHALPHLCWHPELGAAGSCRVCSVLINGRSGAACTVPAGAGLEVRSDTPELQQQRQRLLQMLFVEGNHFCPACEKSGDCRLQASAYAAGMEGPHFEEFYPQRPVDASHPEVWLDLNRCILCGLCVRASEQLDHKSVFAIGGHGLAARLLVDSPDGRLAGSAIAAGDQALDICPTGALLRKRVGFRTPIGRRHYDLEGLDGASPTPDPEAAP